MNDHEYHKTTILFVNLYTDMGGGEVALYHLLKEMNRTKFEPIMVFNGRGPFVERVEALGVRTVILPFRMVMLKQLINPMTCWRLIRSSRAMDQFLRINAIDVVHCSDVLSLLIVGFPATRMRIPIVYSVIFFYEWTRMMAFNLLALLLVRTIVTNSDAVKDDLLRQTVYLSRKVRTLHPGVDTTVFRPRCPGEKNVLREEYHIPESLKLVGMVGRFDPAKGHTVFLSAAVSVLKERNDVRFVVAGGLLNAGTFSSLNRYRRQVMDLASREALSDKILFIGHRDDMPEVIRSLDLLVCPSVNEGFGLVVVEAAASGVPVVASRTVGALEVLKAHESISAAEPGDINSFVSKILQALETLPPKSYHEKAAQKRPFTTWKQYTEQFEKIYGDPYDENNR